MTYSTPGAKHHRGLDALASRYVDVASMPWVDLPFKGVKGKILLMDDKRGVLTALVHMDPGSEIPFHEHTGIEQTLMLEGSLVDQDGECRAGQYVWRPPGNRHVAKSPKGALMIVMFDSQGQNAAAQRPSGSQDRSNPGPRQCGTVALAARLWPWFPADRD